MTRRPSYVVTGAASGVGRAIAQHLAEHGHVVVLDVAEQLDQPDARLTLITGDAGGPDTAARAAAVAEDAGPLVGWVNNAAVFRDASLATASPADVLEAITANLALAVTGCATAVRHLLAHQRHGAIVNVSSHQAQRPVRGALPYATAKAAIEGLTRAVAVDHGPDGIRTNAVALGTITTPRYESYRATHPEVDADMAALHPLGRVGTPARSPPPSPSCSRPQRALSTAPSLPSTAAEPSTALTPKPPETTVDHRTLCRQRPAGHVDARAPISTRYATRRGLR